MAGSSYQVTNDAFITDTEDYTGDNVWNAIYTIQLGELIEHGVFDWSNTLLDWSAAAYDSEQYQRVCAYFIERFRFREISIEPFYEWATRLHARIVYELCPKYNKLYKIADALNPLQVSDDYEKRRKIGSDYPETLLSGNSDYISTGTDEEHEHVTEGDTVEKMADYTANFQSIDKSFLDELEKFFIGLYTVSANAL